VPKTLLAVDDSATMRKVLEITFSGEDFRVITADSSQAALGKLSEEPRVVVIDTVLGSDDGYALSREIRKRDASATILLLSSRHNPYDAAKGRDSGADDYMDKPFDTQQMVDKVRKIAQAREAGVPSSAAGSSTVIGVSPAAPLAPAAAPPAARPAPAPAPTPAATPAPAAAAAPAAAKPSAGRAHTLMFGGNEPQPKAAPAPTPAPTPVAAAPAPKPAPAPAAAAAAPAPRPQAPATTASPAPPKVSPAAAPTPAPVAAAASPAGSVAGKVNGQLAGKLGDLGLTPQQVEGVLALSREVVERVVWEVVPELAETLIKEEIARLMKP
jgi:CheY-like chemotaxis protein